MSLAMRWCCAVVLCALGFVGAAGCEHDCTCPGVPPGEDGGGEQREITVEIGLGGGDDGLAFVPLEEGGAIPLNTFGQGGTHVTIGLRARGLGTNVAFFDVSVENTLTGAVVSTVPTTKPQLWFCDEDRLVCDYLPVHVMTGGLAPIGIENRDGLRVIVTADVRDEQGRRGRGSQEGVLDWQGPPPRARDAGTRDEDAGGEDLDAGE